MNKIDATGGARVGWINWTWPFAKLSADFQKLRLKIRLDGEYIFEPGQVISLKKYGVLPVIATGIQINHSRLDYPEKIIFWYLGNPMKLIKSIETTGFVPSCDPSSVPIRPKGFPLKWSFIIFFLVVWNLLFIVDMQNGRELGIYAFLALIFAFVLSISILKVKILQNLILRKGHQITEISHFIILVAGISGLMSVITIIGLLNKNAS